MHHLPQLKQIVRSYDIEAKWLLEKYVPSFDEYMRNAKITAGNILVTRAALLGMGEVATVQAFEWVQSNSKIITASNTVLRLNDDIMSHEV